MSTYKIARWPGGGVGNEVADAPAIDRDTLAFEVAYHHGGIVRDLAVRVFGGPGFGCSGDIGKGPSLSGPPHCRAPICAGSNNVTSIATLLAARVTLDGFDGCDMGHDTRRRRRR